MECPVGKDFSQGGAATQSSGVCYRFSGDAVLLSSGEAEGGVGSAEGVVGEREDGSGGELQGAGEGFRKAKFYEEITRGHSGHHVKELPAPAGLYGDESGMGG